MTTATRPSFRAWLKRAVRGMIPYFTAEVVGRAWRVVLSPWFRTGPETAGRFTLECLTGTNARTVFTTVFEWEVLNDDVIRNAKYGSFRRNDGVWVFTGSYENSTWMARWRSRYLVSRDFPELLRGVEHLVSKHEGTRRRSTRLRTIIVFSVLLISLLMILWIAQLIALPF
jgi:hypothetical protein